MKITIYINENTDFLSNFNPFRAQLRKAVEFDLDATEPPFDFDYEAAKDLDNEAFDQAYTEARKAHAKWVDPILNGIYEQLNVGGDIFPAEAYTVEYRLAGNRSLSVGDLIVLEWDRTLENVTMKDGSPAIVTEREAYSVESLGYGRRGPASLIVRKGEENYAKADKSDHFVPVPRTDIEVRDGFFALKEGA